MFIVDVVLGKMFTDLQVGAIDLHRPAQLRITHKRAVQVNRPYLIGVQAR
ncbi:MAG: hypothetical protein ABI925_08195 [Verrucomicrobiota bacterium]